jgi:hypothetical protein
MTYDACPKCGDTGLNLVPPPEDGPLTGCIIWFCDACQLGRDKNRETMKAMFAQESEAHD